MTILDQLEENEEANTSGRDVKKECVRAERTMLLVMFLGGMDFVGFGWSFGHGEKLERI